MIAQQTHKASPVACTRCDWLGTLDLTAQGARCVVCGARVNPLRQKGLDNLRTHYRILLKMGHHIDWTLERRATEQERLERFFGTIEEPLRGPKMIAERSLARSDAHVEPRQ